MSSHPHLGLLEYGLVIGAVLALAVREWIAVVRAQRAERRMRKGSKERTQGR